MVDDLLIPAYVGELIPPLAKTIQQDDEKELAWATKIAAQSAALLQGLELKVTRVRRHGDPKHEHPKAAEEWDADCIFVGSAGFSNRLEKFVLGSVSDRGCSASPLLGRSSSSEFKMIERVE